jgi:hypothetical protein
MMNFHYLYGNFGYVLAEYVRGKFLVNFYKNYISFHVKHLLSVSEY